MSNDPLFCITCGRTTAFEAFSNTLGKIEQLIVLASRMIRKSETPIKTVLLEQGVVAIISSMEILMRESYSIAYDHKHVVMGQSVYNDTYARSRNEFLNLGSANRWLKRILALDLKSILSETDYGFLSRMYSDRHIIVHNSSIKDKQYLSQTAEPESQLRQPLVLKVGDVRKLVRISIAVGRKIATKLAKSLMSFQQVYLNTVRLVGG